MRCKKDSTERERERERERDNEIRERGVNKKAEINPRVDATRTLTEIRNIDRLPK